MPLFRGQRRGGISFNFTQMVQILIKEDYAEMMLDLKPHIALFNLHGKILSPYRETLLKNWGSLYRRHFGQKSRLADAKRRVVFEKWIDLFLEALRMKNLAPHYNAMVEFGRELTDMGISLEEIIFSLHFFEEVSMPFLMKHYPDKKKLTRMVFALDMLFHNELACLSLAYFYRYRSEIARLEKMKDDLTHMIVHDLKNPMNVVSIAADSLIADIRSDGQIRDTQYLEIISNASKNTWQMVNNLLDINKMEQGKFTVRKTRNGMDSLIDEITNGVKPRLEKKRIRISFLKGNVPEFPFDRDIIRRVIGNLLDNALKFSPDRGTVTIASRVENGRAFVSMHNTGPGIRKEDRERIFEKFGQAGLAAKGKIHGTGLGLTFCRMAVEASGGEISVESGKSGTTFSFYLPVS